MSDNIHYLKWKDLVTLKLKARDLVKTMKPQTFYNFIYLKFENTKDKRFITRLLTQYQKEWTYEHYPEMFLVL